MGNARGPRPVVFVCIGSDERQSGDFVSKVIQATSQAEASSLFFEKTGIKMKTIHGPFRPKRMQVLENTRTLRFTDQSKPAIYDSWNVTAFMLKEPEDHAYLIFLTRTDDGKQPPPKGTIVVPVSDLRFEQ